MRCEPRSPHEISGLGPTSTGFPQAFLKTDASSGLRVRDLPACMPN